MGIILKINSGIYHVKYDGGIIECSIRGKMKKAGITPVVGDKCIFEFCEDNKGVITEIIPRKNSLIRPKLSNVDNLLVVFAAAEPKPQLAIIDRLTVTAEQKGIKPIIVITKSDIAPIDVTTKYENIYKSAGYDVIVTSSNCKDDVLEKLKPLFLNKITAVAGCSGVGKSTFLNKIFGESSIKTGEISSKNSRGRHTTTCIELYEKSGGLIADTPGFSSLDIFDAEKEELENYFPEIKSRLGNCKFIGCSHITEPSCVIKEAVARGEILPERYESYVSLYEDIKNRKKY